MTIDFFFHSNWKANVLLFRPQFDPLLLLPLVCKMCPKKTETLIMWRPLNFGGIFPIILAWRHYNAERLIRCKARHISNSCERLENVFGPPSLKDFFPPRSFFIYQCSFLQNDLVRHPSFKQQRWKRLALLSIIENATNARRGLTGCVSSDFNLLSVNHLWRLQLNLLLHSHRVQTLCSL